MTNLNIKTEDINWKDKKLNNSDNEKSESIKKLISVNISALMNSISKKMNHDIDDTEDEFTKKI